MTWPLSTLNFRWTSTSQSTRMARILSLMSDYAKGAHHETQSDT